MMASFYGIKAGAHPKGLNTLYFEQREGFDPSLQCLFC